jgi:hypothetical protein|tara:strand:- start:1005 stop:2069 length:1065 start_codon:yes stop_codon:yes gene_type:complete
MPKKTDKQLASLIAEAESDKIKDLKNTNERLLRQIDKLKDKKADLIEAVYQGARDGMSTLTLPKISKTTIPNKKTKDTEICVPLLSDIQLAKRTPDYDSKIAEKRVIEYANRIVKLTKIQRQSHNVNKCVVLALGDIVEGELIFPGQSHLIDSSLYRQVTVDGPRILYAFFTTLLQEFDEVECYWVIGNHGALGGRSRRDYNPETNADRMLGKILDTMFANEKRIKFHIPEGVDQHWYTVADLGVKAKFFCFHGDNIRGSMGLPFYGYNKKILGWKALASQGLMENFTHAVCGHYHTPTSLYINDVRVWVNGSTESYNSYAQEQLASMGRPSQFCLFVKPSKGVTAEYLVNLEE